MKKFIFIAICVLLSGVCRAQLIYQNAALTFAGPRHNGTYMTTWHGWAHAWVDVENSNRFLTFELSNLDPRIASGSGNIAFFDLAHGYHTIQVGNIFNASDVSLKSNIKSLNSATSTVMQLRPVTYTMNRGVQGNSIGSVNSKDYGFVAQEVERVLPEIVMEDEEGLKLVNYSAIIPILTATIQELNERIASLEAKVNELSK